MGSKMGKLGQRACHWGRTVSVYARDCRHLLAQTPSSSIPRTHDAEEAVESQKNPNRMDGYLALFSVELWGCASIEMHGWGVGRVDASVVVGCAR